MFGYIRGEIAEKKDGTVLLENNGVGYELAVSQGTAAKCREGENVRLYCYLQVKDDGLSLYGFADKEEKSMFLRLISVSGVGCKVALSVLSGMDSGSLALAIYNGDTKSLTKIKGLGKKTAERLVLELREKVTADAQDFCLSGSAEEGVFSAQFTKPMNDALSVLVSLGKNRADAERLVDAASKLGAETTEELINMSFRIN